MKKFTWNLHDIIMIGIISLIFAVIYLGAVYGSIALTATLTPMGLGVFGNEIFFGIWFMAATLAPYIIRKPGTAITAEILASFIEVLMGNMYGPIVFVSGFIQGAGAEVAFAATKYRKYDLKTMILASLGCTVFSFIWGFFRSGFLELEIGLLVIMFIVRFMSALLFSTVITKLLADALAKAGVLRGYPISSKYNTNLETNESY